jgi:hypothetical protein
MPPISKRADKWLCVGIMFSTAVGMEQAVDYLKAGDLRPAPCAGMSLSVSLGLNPANSVKGFSARDPAEMSWKPVEAPGAKISLSDSGECYGQG